MVRNATPDGGAEVTVAGVDVLQAMGLTERDLQSAKFDLVQADKSTQLLSIGQLDVPVRYGSSAAIITVVFCPEIRGMLISWLDCIALGILHHDYPRPIFSTQSSAAVSAVNETSILDSPVSEKPSEEQID